MKTIEYNDPITGALLKSVSSLGHKINSVIESEKLGSIPGKKFNFDQLAEGAFELKDKRNGQAVAVKYNSIIPNQELFSLALELVQPAIEEFEASNIFTSDTGFDPGADVVGADILSRTGKARLAVRGVDGKTDIPRLDIALDRATQLIAKLDGYVKVTRDDIQRLAARNNAGNAPMFDFMTEKLNTARWAIGRDRELLIWKGGFLEGQSIGIDSIFSYFSTTSGDYSGTNPTKGKQAPVATQETVVDWDAKLALASGKGGMYIMEDIADTISYVQRIGAYKVTHIVLPRRWMNKLSMTPYSITDSTTILTTIQKALPGIKFVGTTALDYAHNTDLTSVKSGFLALDARRQNYVIADPEPVNFLPAVTDKEGSVEQVARAQSAGILTKHPAAGAFYTGIDA